VIPLAVCREYTGFGDRDSEGYVTWAIYPYGENEFTLHNPDGSGTTTVTVTCGDGDLGIRFEGVEKPHILRVLLPGKPAGVTLDGTPLAEGTAWSYNEGDYRLWVKTESYAQGRYTIATGS